MPAPFLFICPSPTLCMSRMREEQAPPLHKITMILKWVRYTLVGDGHLDVPFRKFVICRGWREEQAPPLHKITVI